LANHLPGSSHGRQSRTEQYPTRGEQPRVDFMPGGVRLHFVRRYSSRTGAQLCGGADSDPPAAMLPFTLERCGGNKTRHR
jgi:hypothetical protein